MRSAIGYRLSAIGAALLAGQPPATPAPQEVLVMIGQESPPNTLTKEEQGAGWRLLFDGKTTNGWRGYLMDSMPAGWAVVEGSLARVAPAADIIYQEKFRNFELLVDWKIVPKGNSGIFYRGIEGPEALYYSAPEMQVLDDAGHGDGVSPLTSAGAVYGLYPAPRGIVKPAGEWNRARIVVNGTHVEHRLNGRQIAAYELGSADWKARVEASKFKQWPEYGKAGEGYIGLQEHGNRIEYRNIKIRVLP